MINRKIKVRVWLKTLGRFVTKNEWILDLDGDLYFRNWNPSGEYLEKVPEENYIVQQYTGLLDKNKKEIYDGDILERIGNGSFCKIVVGWSDKECCFIHNNVGNLHGSSSPLHDNFVNLCDWTYWAVCGNIMENQELIQ